MFATHLVSNRIQSFIELFYSDDLEDAFQAFESTPSRFSNPNQQVRKVFASDKVYGEWEVVEAATESPSQGEILDLSQIKEELRVIEDDQGQD